MSLTPVTVGRLPLVVAVLCGLALLGGASTATAAPANDDFENAIPIRAGQTVKGTIDGATVQRAEARYGSEGGSVWYRFEAKRELVVELSVCRANFPVGMILFRGRSLRSLKPVDINPHRCGRGGRITFRSRRGRNYAIAVSGASSTRGGTFRLRVAPFATPPNDDFVDAQPLRLGSTVSGWTALSSGERGEPRTGSGIRHTVWYRLRVATAGQVRLDACNQTAPWIVVYTGDRVNRLTRVAYFGFCRVQFAAEPGVNYRVAVDDRGEWGRFWLSASAVTPPPNDDFADATAITLGTISGTTRAATREPGEPIGLIPPRPYGVGGPFTVWFRLAVVATTWIEVGPISCAAGFITVYTGEHLNQLQQVSEHRAPTTPPCGFQFEAPPGVYSIRIEAGVFEEGDFEFTARAVQPPG